LLRKAAATIPRKADVAQKDVSVSKIDEGVTITKQKIGCAHNVNY